MRAIGSDAARRRGLGEQTRTADDEEWRESLRLAGGPALASSSGPTPAGSPSETANGRRIGINCIRSPRRGADRADSACARLLTRSSSIWSITSSKLGPAAGPRIVAAAQHEHAHAVLDRAERRRGLADRQRRAPLLQRRRQVAHLDLVVLDDLRAEFRRRPHRPRRSRAPSASPRRTRSPAWSPRRRCPGGEVDRDLLEASTASRGSAGQHLALVDHVEDVEYRRVPRPARPAGRARAALPRRQAGSATGRHEPSRDRRRRPRSRLPNIAAHRRRSCRPADLVDDLLGIGEDLIAVLGRRGEVDLADMIFLGALRRLEPRDDLLHLVSPTLMNGSTLRRSRRCQASSPSIWRLSEAGDEPTLRDSRSAPAAALEVLRRRRGRRCWSTSSSLTSTSLALASWISSVSSIRLRSTWSRSRCFSSALTLPLVGGEHQREPLVDVGVGDDVAVDDRGRACGSSDCCRTTARRRDVESPCGAAGADSWGSPDSCAITAGEGKAAARPSAVATP